jgi:hypothetical protein
LKVSCRRPKFEPGRVAESNSRRKPVFRRKETVIVPLAGPAVKAAFGVTLLEDNPPKLDLMDKVVTTMLKDRPEAEEGPDAVVRKIKTKKCYCK